MTSETILGEGLRLPELLRELTVLGEARLEISDWSLETDDLIERVVLERLFNERESTCLSEDESLLILPFGRLGFSIARSVTS